MVERDKLAKLETEIRDITLALRICVARVSDMTASLTDLMAEPNVIKREASDRLITVAKTLYGEWLEWTYKVTEGAAEFKNLTPAEIAPFVTSAGRILRAIGYIK